MQQARGATAKKSKSQEQRRPWSWNSLWPWPMVSELRTLIGAVTLTSAATFAYPSQAAPAASLAEQSPSSEVRFTASDKLSELKLLRTLPRSVLEARIAEWRAQFDEDLARNDSLVSDAAILILEALLLGDSRAAFELSQRYNLSVTAKRAPYPGALREGLSAADASHLSELLTRKRVGSRETTPGSTQVQIRVHPFWWNERGCAVAINGVPTLPRQSASVRAGSAFYVQRICVSAHNNRLATGRTPLGRDVLFVALRTSDDDSVLGKQGSTDQTTSVQGLGGFLWGQLGKMPLEEAGSGGPLQALGIRLVSHSGWSFQAVATSVRPKASGAHPATDANEPQAPTADSEVSEAGRLAQKRTLARIIIERRGLFDLHVLGPGTLRAGPLVGLGLTGLHGEGRRASDWEYLAPTGNAGAELVWQCSLGPERTLEAGIRAAALMASPPFRGLTREVFAIIGMTF